MEKEASNRLNLLFILLFFGLAIFLSSLSQAYPSDHFMVSLNASDFNITKDYDDYDFIEMEEFGQQINPGYPMLPHKMYDILLPPDVNESSIQLKVISADAAQSRNPVI